MRKALAYLAFLSPPLLLVLLMGFQWLLAAGRPPRPELAFIAAAPGRDSRLIADAARAGGAARLLPRPLESAQSGPSLVFWNPGRGDGGLAAAAELAALADSGSAILIGYKTLTGTQGEGPEALAAAAGCSSPRWIGAYVLDLAAGGEVPAGIRHAWEAQNKGPWRFSGEGIFMQGRASGEVLVLRRGIELGKGALRVEGGKASRADGYFAGWFCIVEAAAGTEVKALFRIDALAKGKALLQAAGVPENFPALVLAPRGEGGIWAMAGDFAGNGTKSEFLGPLPAPQLESRMTLDSPGNAIGHFHRILVPLLAEVIAPIGRGAPNR